jgi:UDP-N-acetylmuramoylalanine-D-glutamate ligase
MNERTTHRVAILGFGIMGSAFARCASSAGLAVTRWDRMPERVAALAARAHQQRHEASRAAPLDSGWSVEPGAATRFVNGFSVPPGFVPVRLALIEAATTKGALRIALMRGDISAAAP